MVYVAAQLGHSAAMTLSTYGQVITEVEDAPRWSAEDAVCAARATHVRRSFV